MSTSNLGGFWNIVLVAYFAVGFVVFGLGFGGVVGGATLGV